MSDERSGGHSLAEIFAHSFCQDPKPCPDEILALHKFKHKVLAAAFELYQEIGVEAADKHLSHYFEKPSPKTNI